MKQQLFTILSFLIAGVLVYLVVEEIKKRKLKKAGFNPMPITELGASSTGSNPGEEIDPGIMPEIPPRTVQMGNRVVMY